MTKTPFIKLYEPKNLLTLKRVLKLIGIRPLNDVVVIEDSTGEGVSLDLSKIDDISSSEFTISETSGLLELPVPGPSKLLKPKNRPLKPIFRPSEELIKPIDSSNPDEIQLDLVTSLCYRVKAKIFKKKFDKNNFTSNTYKQALKSPNVKE